MISVTRMRRRTEHQFAIFLVLLLVIAGCAPRPRRVVTVLIDYSRSDTSQLVAQASLVADTIVPLLAPFDELIVLPIDDGSVQQPARIVDVDLAQLSFGGDSDGVAHAAQYEATRRLAFLDSIRSQVRRSILAAVKDRRRFAAHTPLLGAISHAATMEPRMSPIPNLRTRVQAALFGDERYATKVILVIASDMLQEADGLDFAHAPPSSPRDIETLIGDIKKRVGIPDLSGVDVIVSGATGERAAQVRDVRGFWMAYFREAHACIVAYDYQAAAAAWAYFKTTR